MKAEVKPGSRQRSSIKQAEVMFRRRAGDRSGTSRVSNQESQETQERWQQLKIKPHFSQGLASLYKGLCDVQTEMLGPRALLLPHGCRVLESSCYWCPDMVPGAREVGDHGLNEYLEFACSNIWEKSTTSMACTYIFT